MQITVTLTIPDSLQNQANLLAYFVGFQFGVNDDEIRAFAGDLITVLYDVMPEDLAEQVKQSTLAILRAKRSEIEDIAFDLNDSINGMVNSPAAKDRSPPSAGA